MAAAEFLLTAHKSPDEYVSSPFDNRRGPIQSRHLQSGNQQHPLDTTAPMFRGTAALSLLLACASALQLPGGGMPAGLTIPAGLSATTTLGISPPCPWHCLT